MCAGLLGAELVVIWQTGVGRMSQEVPMSLHHLRAISGLGPGLGVSGVMALTAKPQSPPTPGKQMA